jgi:cobalamin biosynthesis Mg chelatase CobN
MRCGAAVRGRARFCPQCGLEMSEAPTLNRPAAALGEEQAHASSGRLVDEAERVALALNDSLPPTAADAGNVPSKLEQRNQTGVQAQAQTQTPQPTAQTQTAANGSTTPLANAALMSETNKDRSAQAAHTAADTSSSRLNSVRSRAGERVERLREASVVVFDEAHDDPALRFVLVAAALFVIFLLILLFSYLLH